jgi:hypothetical protein
MDALKFYHEKIRALIPNNLLKIREICGICGSISESGFKTVLGEA